MQDKTIIDPIEATLDEVTDTIFGAHKASRGSKTTGGRKAGKPGAEIVQFPRSFKDEKGELVPCVVEFVWNNPYDDGEVVHSEYVDSGDPESTIQNLRNAGGQYFQVNQGHIVFLPWPPLFVRITDAG